METATNYEAKIRYIARAAEKMQSEGSSMKLKAVERISQLDNTVSSFEIDMLIESDGLIRVGASVTAWIENADMEGEQLFKYIVDRIMENSIRSWKPNSTSNASVELELSSHFAWMKIASAANDCRVN